MNQSLVEERDIEMAISMSSDVDLYDKLGLTCIPVPGS